MTSKDENKAQMLFERSDNGVYFSEIRPTQYTPGLLVEVCKEKTEWTGAYFTFHETHSCDCASKSDCPYQSRVGNNQTDYMPCFMAPTKDLVSAKIIIRSDDFKNLVNGMKSVFAVVPETNDTLSMEEKAAISVATEMVWHFPSKILEEIHGKNA